MSDTQFLDQTQDGTSYQLAYRLTNEAAGTKEQPGVFWLSGFKSDMAGSKAQALADWAARTGRACTRFDYFGHGESDGAFVDGTISRWVDDAVTVFDRATTGPQILVGSSMGGWIACLLARRHLQQHGRVHSRIAGMVLIAPALDFTEVLMWDTMSEEIQRQIMETGQFARPSDYSDDPYVITRALIEDGRKNLLLNKPIEVGAPVHILQGQKDTDVPWPHALRIAEALTHDDVVLTFVKNGDHRLSSEADLERLIRAVEWLV